MRLHRAQVGKGPQGAGHTEDEAADGEGQQLGPEQRDADHRGGGIHVAHRHPVASQLAAHQVAAEPEQRQYQAEGEQVAPGRRSEVQPRHPQRRRADHPGGVVIGEPAEPGQRPLHEELRGQGRNQQVEALDAQARQAEDDGHQGRRQPAEEDAEQQRQARHAQLEVVGGEGADRHEGRRAQRQLAGVAGQQVQPEPGQGQHQEGNQDGIEPVVAA
ncbi:hypothetical protein D9M69_302790 [compost metagenome]